MQAHILVLQYLPWEPQIVSQGCLQELRISYGDDLGSWWFQLLIVLCHLVLDYLQKMEEMLQGTNSDTIYQTSTWGIYWDNRTSSRKDAPSTY